MTRASLQDIAALSRRREREKQGRFLVEGVRSVEAALAAGAPLLAVLATAEAAADARVATVLAGAGALVTIVPARDLERISDARTSQGVAAVAASVAADYAAGHDAAEAETVLVLDGVQDPGNVGTMVRTAAWFGIDLLVAGPGTADLESPKVVRAAMGGLWSVRLRRAIDLPDVLDDLARGGIALVGAEMDGQPVRDWRPAGRVALILGSEAHGLAESTRARLMSTVGIHRAGAGAGAESLNVAVAAGILLHRWRGNQSAPDDHA